MRPIPVALKNKLLNRFKAESNDCLPKLKMIAKQTTVNTLQSEIIHEDIKAAFGDVALRQMEGESEISLAYAICLDEGKATIYKRLFPASIERKWAYQWTHTDATDVAIEYDGVWKLDNSKEWYYLQTEQYPYIFTVESGSLYVQHWQDESTRTLLASGVSVISSCKGWQNNIQPELDQGMIIGYTKEGEVYYRAYCTQDDGTKVWEAERKVTELGTGNESICVTRTNDFRIGFLTENDGKIKLVLSGRNYAGMSVRPETLRANIKAKFKFPKVVFKNGYMKRERVKAVIDHSFFNFDTSPETEEISIVSSERLNREEEFYSYGVVLYLSKPITGELTDTFINKASVKVVNGTATSTVKIKSAEYDAENNGLILYFAEDIKRTCVLTVTTVSMRTITYERVQKQKWFIPAFTAQFESEAIRKDGYAGREYVSASVSGGFEFDKAVFTKTKNRESASVSVTAAFTLAPVSSLPI